VTDVELDVPPDPPALAVMSDVKLDVPPGPPAAVMDVVEAGRVVCSGLEGVADDKGKECESVVEEDDPALLWLPFSPSVPPTAPPMIPAMMMMAMRARVIFARVLAQIGVARLWSKRSSSGPAYTLGTVELLWPYSA